MKIIHTTGHLEQFQIECFQMESMDLQVFFFIFVSNNNFLMNSHNILFCEFNTTIVLRLSAFVIAVDRTCYISQFAGKDGSLGMLPIYLDHILYPTLAVSL